MSVNWNNVKPACCARWLVLPTVYSDALSYGEQLDKFCYQLNQLIENNNILPDFIAEMIREYIDSGAMGEVVRDILAHYILNVKYPPKGIKPAVGDGSADDTEAIQGCIDYASDNGGVVYFPYGSYLTQSLTLKDGVSLFGFDRYSTKIALKGGATKPLICGTVSGLSISNLTLDGNSSVQVNNVNVVTVMATDMLMTNLIIKDGYTLVNYYGTGGHLQVSDVIFGNAVEKCLLTAGDTNVQAENLLFNHLSSVGGVSVMDIGTDGGYFNIKSVATCDKCIVVNGNKNNIEAIVENSATPITDNGLKNNIKISGFSSKLYFESNTTKEVNGSYSKHVGSAYTKAVEGNGSESYDGNYNKIVSGVTSETYKGNITITEENETKTAKKIITNASNFNVKVNDEFNATADNQTFNATSQFNVTADNQTFNGDEIKLNCTNPLTYKKPTNLNRYFNSVKFKDSDDNNYDVLVYNKNFVTYNVKDYGAKGDGVTDDTNAIKSALNKLVGGIGGIIYFPTGTYLISNTIMIGGNVTICGDGVFNSNIKLADNSNCNVISNADGVIMYYLSIHDIGIDGNVEHNSSGSGILLHNVSDTQIYNVRITNFKENGIHLTSNKYSLSPMIYNCFIRGSDGKTTGSGIFSDGSVTDLIISDIDVGWCGTAGINLTAANGSSIINAMCWQCGVGIKFYNCQRMRILNCLSDFSKTWGWTLQKCYLYTISNSHSKNSSQVTPSFYSEFYIEDSTFIMLDNCVAISEGKSKYGLECKGNTNYVKISNSDFSNNSKDVDILGENSCIDKATLNICDKNANIDVTNKAEIILNIKEYNCDIINVYGETSSSVNIILPKLNKIWLIVNATKSNLLVSDAEKNEPITISNNSKKLVYFLNDKINVL